MLEVTDNVFCAHLKKLDLGCVQNGIHHKVKSIYLFIWLKTTEIYSFIVLEAVSPKSKCWQRRAPSKACRRGSFLVFSNFLWPRQYLAYSNRTQSPPLLHMATIPLCLCSNISFLIRTPVMLV